jgi:hypothetical protein
VYMLHSSSQDNLDPNSRTLKLEGAQESLSFKCCATMCASAWINTGAYWRPIQRLRGGMMYLRLQSELSWHILFISPPLMYDIKRDDRNSSASSYSRTKLLFRECNWYKHVAHPAAEATRSFSGDAKFYSTMSTQPLK